MHMRETFRNRVERHVFPDLYIANRLFDAMMEDVKCVDTNNIDKELVRCREFARVILNEIQRDFADLALWSIYFHDASRRVLREAQQSTAELPLLRRRYDEAERAERRDEQHTIQHMIALREKRIAVLEFCAQMIGSFPQGNLDPETTEDDGPFLPYRDWRPGQKDEDE